MSGDNDFEAQIAALKRVLEEHPDARLSITGGEPGLTEPIACGCISDYDLNLLGFSIGRVNV
jgi:hypothetical protein